MHGLLGHGDPLDVVDTSNTVVASKEVTVTCKPT